MEDHHVDRPDVEARQRAQLTGTNRSFGLIALVAKAASSIENANKTISKETNPKRQFCFYRTTDAGRRTTERPRAFPPPVLRPPSAAIRPLPAWWPLQGDQTRSHPELGRQTPQRQWYSVSRHGRVGRRQACKGRMTTRKNASSRRSREDRNGESRGSSSPKAPRIPAPAQSPLPPPLAKPPSPKTLPRGGAAR